MYALYLEIVLIMFVNLIVFTYTVILCTYIRIYMHHITVDQLLCLYVNIYSHVSFCQFYTVWSRSGPLWPL